MSRSTQRALEVASDRIVKQEDQIHRALQVLQKAQRYDLDPHGDYYQGDGMVHCDTGDWIPIEDAVKAIQILEGQQ